MIKKIEIIFFYMRYSYRFLMNLSADHQTSKAGNPKEEKSNPMYFIENTSCTTGAKIVLPRSFTVSTCDLDSKGKKIDPFRTYEVATKSGRTRAYSDLTTALRVSGQNMVQCPEGSGWLIPVGDIWRVQAHLKHHLPEKFAALLKESGQPKFLPSIYVYPEGFFLNRRYISPHCPDKSFETKRELDNALKKANPPSTKEMHLEEMCPHGKKCHGLNGACPKNHGMSLCNHEKNSKERCGNPFCRYDHWAGKVEHSVCKRIQHLEGEEKKAGKAEEVAKEETTDLTSPGAFDSLKSDSSGESDDEDDESAIKVAESVLQDDDDDSVSSASASSVSSKFSDVSGFKKVGGRRSRSREEKLKVLKDQLATLRKEKASRKKKKHSEKSSPKAIETPPLPGSSGEAVPIPDWKAKCAVSRAKSEEALRLAREKAEIEEAMRLAKEKAEAAIKARNEALLEKAREEAARQTEEQMKSDSLGMHPVATEEADSSITEEKEAGSSVTEEEVDLSKMTSKERKKYRKALKQKEKESRRVSLEFLGLEF